jgi:hypothetical protein
MMFISFEIASLKTRRKKTMKEITDERESTNTAIHDFIVQTEAVYKGLGLPVLYGVLSILANKSVFYIGGRGVGKTRVIKCIPYVDGVVMRHWDTFTLGELDILCEEFSELISSAEEKHFVFKVHDFSTLSEYHREIFLTVCSKIISDNEYRHVTTITPHLLIVNSKLTMLIAIQPRIYSFLSHRYAQWESMSTDRVSKFLFLNPLRENKTVDTNFLPTLPRKIPPSAECPTSLDLSKLIALFSSQVSEGRAFLYAKDYATAIARFQGKTTVEQNDIDCFYSLFSPYLGSFSRLQTRKDFEDSVTVCSGHIELLTQIGQSLDGRIKQELAQSLYLTERHIERCASDLLSKKLIREEEGKYHLSTELEQFFRWYKDTFSAQMSPNQNEPNDNNRNSDKKVAYMVDPDFPEPAQTSTKEEERGDNGN